MASVLITGTSTGIEFRVTALVLGRAGHKVYPPCAIRRVRRSLDRRPGGEASIKISIQMESIRTSSVESAVESIREYDG